MSVREPHNLDSPDKHGGLIIQLCKSEKEELVSAKNEVVHSISVG